MLNRCLTVAHGTFQRGQPRRSLLVSSGDGDIPIASLLAATLPAHQAPLTLTIETHAPSEPAVTTRRSVHGVRRMIDGLGLT